MNYIFKRKTMWGVSYLVWTLVCLAIALVYYFILPKTARSPLLKNPARLILRYSHSLVWLLLAGAALLAHTGHVRVGKLAALAGLAVYIIFMSTLVVSGIRIRSRKTDI
ncbi:MAG: hypothetical protein RBT38_13840 [Bacteroidales bacterium]|nr:hypothetical protein [Bacteroidales bacterium]